MELEEFKRQFQARRQEAQHERDELSMKAEDLLKKYEPLIELEELCVADFEAAKFGEAVKRLKDHGFNNWDELDKELDKLGNDVEDILAEHEKLEDELSRRTLICPQCHGWGFIKGKPIWVEGDTGRIPIPKRNPCSLCKGKRRFEVDELLHC